MTLKEQFEQYAKEEIWRTRNYNAEECELIADEFAIGFLQFIEGTYSYSNIFDNWYLHANTSIRYTPKELLEIYKKEKGL